MSTFSSSRNGLKHESRRTPDCIDRDSYWKLQYSYDCPISVILAMWKDRSRRLGPSRFPPMVSTFGGLCVPHCLAENKADNLGQGVDVRTRPFCRVCMTTLSYVHTHSSLHYRRMTANLVFDTTMLSCIKVALLTLWSRLCFAEPLQLLVFARL